MTNPIDASGLAGVHLTSVPAAHPAFAGRDVDWTDQAVVHRCVMSLFRPDLPGPDGERRAYSAILYRLEMAPTGPRVLVQSAVAPNRLDHGMATTTLAGLARLVAGGTAIQFRLDVNAVRTQSRTGRRLAVPADEVGALLLSRGHPDRPGLLSGAIRDMELLDVRADVTAVGRTPLRVARVTARATIADPDALLGKILNGVGRGKSYGCGLLSIAPVD